MWGSSALVGAPSDALVALFVLLHVLEPGVVFTSLRQLSITIPLPDPHIIRMYCVGIPQ